MYIKSAFSRYNRGVFLFSADLFQANVSGCTVATDPSVVLGVELLEECGRFFLQ